MLIDPTRSAVLSMDLIVIKDCCADLDAALHQCLIDTHFPRVATVVTASEFRKALTSAAT